MTSSGSITILPRITVQHDISTVIADVRDGTVAEEDVWVSCYHEGKPSVHGKVRISRGTRGVLFESREGIDWIGSSTAEFRVSCRTLDIPVKPIRLPKHVYTPLDPQKVKKITAFDVSPDDQLYATGHEDGSIFITSTSPGSTLRRLGKPHLSTILSLSFFPSSTVLLSTSSDLSIRIHDASPSITDPSSLNTVRTLQAHSAGVTSAAIIDRGRNVLSFARDATARLWDVGGTKEIVGRRWRAPRGSPILCGCVGDAWQSINPPLNNPGTTLDGEVATSGKLVFVGLQNGSVKGYELSTGHARFFSSGVDPSLSKGAPVDSIVYSDKGVLVAGRRDGIIMVWDLNSTPRASTAVTTVEDELDWNPTTMFKRSGSGVESLAFGLPPSPNDQLPSILIGTEDGLFCRVGIDADVKPALIEEYIGVEAGDGIRVVRSVMVDGGEVVWSAGDDGHVRRY